MKGQGQLFWVKLVLGFVLIVMALSIGKSCAQLLIPTATESVTSFNNFVTVIENTENWASGTRQNVGLIMDKNSVIFGFSKSAAAIERTEGTSSSGKQLIRPQSCGVGGACICLCRQHTQKDEVLAGRVCDPNSLLCTPLPDIDFQFIIPIEKLVPVGHELSLAPSREALGVAHPPYLIRGGFIFERGESVNFIYTSERIQPLSPRRFSVSVEKADDNKVAVCARTPCAEPAAPVKP